MTSTSAISTQEDTESTNPVPLRVGDILLIVGFILILAWHYLVLFSPIFGDLENESYFDYLFARQFVLYISLAITFGCIWVLGLLRNKKTKRHNIASPKIIALSGFCSTLSSGLYVLASVFQLSLSAHLCILAFLGVSEGFIMFLWLRCFVLKHQENLIKPFSGSMVAGGLLALLVCYFQWPVGPIVTTLIPGVSAIVLTREAKLAKTRREQANINEEEPTKELEKTVTDLASIGIDVVPDERIKQTTAYKAELRRKKLMTIFVAIFALIFGLMQGSQVAAHTPLLIVDNPATLLGVVLAGLIIYTIPSAFDNTHSVDVMHRCSIVLFVFSAVIICWYQLGTTPLLIAQICLLAGFNLFDFGTLLNGIESSNSKISTNQSAIIDNVRTVVYFCLTLGLLLGYSILIYSAEENYDLILLIICGTSVAAVVTTILTPLYGMLYQDDESESICYKHYCTNCNKNLKGAPMIPSSIPPARPEVPAEWESPWRRACEQITRTYQLSPRETEIFYLVAKGRNAEYIQQELIISTHTVKTHIANIYRKLEVHSSQELLSLVEATRKDTNHPDAYSA